MSKDIKQQDIINGDLTPGAVTSHNSSWKPREDIFHIQHQRKHDGIYVFVDVADESEMTDVEAKAVAYEYRTQAGRVNCGIDAIFSLPSTVAVAAGDPPITLQPKVKERDRDGNEKFKPVIRHAFRLTGERP